MDNQKLTFAGAIGVCFKKFFDFRGVAGRREYWYFVLFLVLVSIVVGTIEQILLPPVTVAADALAAALEQDPENLNFELLNAAFVESVEATPISNLIGLITALPLLTAMVRRMRDAGFSAWFLLLSWVPFLTFIFTVLPTKSRPTKPKTSPSA
jgi:uncharacterized membrane protein YhaH (DUF805 family)